MAEAKKKEDENFDELIFAGAEPEEDLNTEDPTPSRGDQLQTEAEKAEAEEAARKAAEEAEAAKATEEEAAAAAKKAEEDEAAKKAAEEEAAKAETPAEDKAEAERKAAEEEQKKLADDKAAGNFIPKARFNEVNDKRKAAEAELARLREEREAAAAPPPFDFDAKETEYMTAVQDGNNEKALEIRKEIRKAESEALQTQFETQSAKTTDATQARIELQGAAQELQTEYPQFDENSDQFDADASEEAIDLFRYHAQKMSQAAALRKAVDFVRRDRGFQGVTDTPAAETPPETPPAKTEELTAAQRKAKLEAEAAQPPAPSTTQRNESERPDLMGMSDEDFDSLSKADLRRLRGDATA